MLVYNIITISVFVFACILYIHCDANSCRPIALIDDTFEVINKHADSTWMFT